MNEKTAKWIRLSYGAVLSISAAAAGLCLMGGALGIYQSGGEQLYTPQKVAEAFAGIAVPVWLFVALCTGAFLLEAILPPRGKGKNIPNPEMNRSRLLSKADMTYCGPQLKAAIEKESKKRSGVIAIGLTLLSVCSAVFLVYAANGSHFSDTDVTGSMVSAMGVFFPCLAVPFAYGVFAVYFCKKSILAECELLKTVPKAAQPAPCAQKSLPWLRWVLLAVAVAIFLYGFFAGGTVDVLTKAVNICTECVGLG